MNCFERCGIVGCQNTILWRTAYGYQKGTRPSCAAGRRAAAVRAVAWDSEASRTYPRFPVGIGGRHGRQVWDFPHGPSTRRQLRGPEEAPQAEDRRQPSRAQEAHRATTGRCQQRACKQRSRPVYRTDSLCVGRTNLQSCPANVFWSWKTAAEQRCGFGCRAWGCLIWRRRAGTSGIISHDPDHASDADHGGHRAGGFSQGIDGLARLCKDVLRHDPFSGWVFVFRNRSATAIKTLVYDGQGFWLCHKRLSSGKFRWWPASKNAATKTLAAHQLQVLLSAGNPETTQAAPTWRSVGPAD